MNFMNQDTFTQIFYFSDCKTLITMTLVSKELNRLLNSIKDKKITHFFFVYRKIKSFLLNDYGW